MPELPEVQTVADDLARRLTGRYIKRMHVRCASLRFTVDPSIPPTVRNRKVRQVRRRAKYILVGFGHGELGIHLGMTGTVRADAAGTRPRKHDHIDWVLADAVLRYHDPRRFGCVFWSPADTEHPLVARAGVEPLSRQFTGRWLFKLARDKKQPIKSLLMDGSKIAGIGNIYAAETLFAARVSPLRRADSVTAAEASRIVAGARKVLRAAIAAGGSTLRDYSYADGKPGYFQAKHRAYGRDGLPCSRCGHPIERRVIAQRASFFCPTCQR